MEKQILKNQASIMLALVGLLDHFQVDDLDYVLALRDRTKETRDVLRGLHDGK